MKFWTRLACVLAGTAAAGLGAPVLATDEPAAPAKAAARAVVEIKPDRIILMDLEKAGDRLVAVGERGYALLSDDGGKSWKAVATSVTRTLTSVAFENAKLGVASGHGGTVVRTEDGGETWTHVPLDEAAGESLLGATSLGGGRFLVYGAFGMYFDSSDGGKTWQKRMVLAEDFDRHISDVLPVGNALLLVAESGTIARSDDGGQTWTPIPSPYAGSFFGALVAPDGSILAYGMRGSAYRTADFGATWQKVETGTLQAFNGGRVLGDGRILLVGNVGLVAESRDNGQSFTSHLSPEGRGFAAVVETSSGLMSAGEGGIDTIDPAWLGRK